MSGPIVARAALICALLIVLALAGAWAAQADPPRNVPAYALDSVTVWRLEVLLAIFIGGYAIATAIWLAAHGRVFSKVIAPGGAGLEAEIAQVEDSTAKATEALDRLERQVAALATALQAE